MNKSNQASIEFSVAWAGPHATHKDRYYLDKINLWRDLFPGDIGDKLAEMEQGQSVSGCFEADALLPPRSEANIHEVLPSQINLQRLMGGAEITPLRGRFYPRGIVSGIADNFPQDRRPFMYLGRHDAKAVIDFNHPLAGFTLDCEATLVNWLDIKEERGGRCNEIVQDVAANGPGMQSGRKDIETDFFAGNPFRREDENNDTCFYSEPRFVQHIDAVARRRISEIYARFLAPGMRVLDLMSSWISHLPEDIEPLSVAGLGMNREELARNERLTDYVVHDLNRDPVLPFGEDEFDAVLCTVSVEYLTNPIEAFKEVARVLRPGCIFVVTFSERWFPPKVVQVWTQLHPFERVGLVMNYFRRSGRFTKLSTESLRGLFRPQDDKYYGMTPYSDPVYAVWGRVNK